MTPKPRLYAALRGWRGQAPRQPGQVRKEAAITSPAWVVVSLSPYAATDFGCGIPATDLAVRSMTLDNSAD